MKKISCNFLIIVGLIMALGIVSTVSAAGNDDPKRPKNTGILSVKTSPVPYPVLVDGVQVGMSNTGEGQEFYLTPGTHRVEVQGPNGKSYVKDLEIVKNRKNCVCLRMNEKTITTPCPYRVEVSGSDKVQDGSLVTYSADNKLNSPNPVSYVWTVFPATARITSGQGTSSITVDSTGLGGQEIRAEVDVSDGSYDAECRQRLPITTFVEKVPEIVDPPKPPPFEFFGGLVFRTFDYDKAVLDQYAIALQNRPDTQAYMIVYQGREKKAVNADKMAKRSIDYLVKSRGIAPNRIMITNGGSRDKTQGDLFLVPPGANQPAPSPR